MRTLMDSMQRGFPMRLITTFVSGCCLWTALFQTGVCDETTHLDAPMMQDPAFSFPEPIISFPSDVIPLWIQALRRPESELRQLAADTIAMAHRRGMDGLAATEPELLAAFQDPNLSPVVGQAVARALIAIDARQAAETLWQATQHGSLDLARIVEPALAAWDFQPARSEWLDRVQHSDYERTRLMLAIQAVATVQETQATEDLFALAADQTLAAPVRVAAAEALGNIHHRGLVDRTREFALPGSSPINRVLAVTILRNHRDPAANALFQQLAGDSQPPVAARAVECLAETDPAFVFQALPNAHMHADVRVRRTSVQALLQQHDPSAVERLGHLLDDPHPSLRRQATQALVDQAADNELHEHVINIADKMMHSDQWRGIEQASVVMVELGQQQAAERLLQLLDYRRPEVYVTSAWALRKLAVPETLPDMLAFAEKRYQAFLNQEVAQIHYPHAAQQLSQLFQAFAQMDYLPANQLLRKYVPKDFSLGDQPRSAACWSLGYLYQDAPPADLVTALEQRLSDIDPVLPESPLVRRMCAVSLGRMKAESALSTLRSFAMNEGPNSAIGQACSWAIKQITGEPQPKPQQQIRAIRNWFLTPVP